MAANQTNLLAKSIYHITDFENLSSIIKDEGLSSNAKMQCGTTSPQLIGNVVIKNRRMTEIKVLCCDNRFVGEFVPFYFCPRSPMLFTVNNGNTGREKGCQKTILHLVSDIKQCTDQKKLWAFSDGNAATAYTMFYDNLLDLNKLDWSIIKSNNWAGERIHKKAAEFLVADSFPWRSIYR